MKILIKKSFEILKSIEEYKKDANENKIVKKK